MTRHGALRLFAAIAIGGGLAFAGPSLPAVGEHSPPTTVTQVELLDEATLVARGAAISVALEAVCPEGTHAFAGVLVSQRVGNSLARGFDSTGFGCTGHPQVVELLVQAQNRPFRRGVAAAEAEMHSCSWECHFVRDAETIEIVK